MPKFGKTLSGYVIIHIGSKAAKFFTVAVDMGLSLSHMRWERGRLQARVPLAQLHLVRRVARASRCRVHLIGRGGLPFFWQAARRRPVLLVGSTVTILLYAVLSSFIWSVNVVGLPASDARKVEALAARAGLRPGALKASLKPRAVEQAAMGAPGILWAHLVLHGTQAYLHAVKALPKVPAKKSAAPGNLVARKEGLVTRVVVYRGVARVKPGDTVTAGSVLIAGVEGPSEEATPDEEKKGPPPTVVAAEGEVYARTFYALTVRVPLKKAASIPTGRRGWSLNVRFEGQSVLRLPFGGNAPLRYDRRSQLWRIFNLPLEVEVTEFRETKQMTAGLPKPIALQKAQEEAKARLKKLLPPSAQLMAESDRTRVDGNTLVETLTAEVEENIAVPTAGRSSDSSVAEQNQRAPVRRPG